MGRRIVEEQNIRSITKNNSGTYSVSIPIQFIRKLRWQQGQRVNISIRGEKLVIEDYSRKSRS